MKNLLNQFTHLIARIGVNPADSEEFRRQKITAVSTYIGGIVVQTFFGGLFLAFGAPVPGWAVMGCAGVMLVSLIIFGVTRRYFQAFYFIGSLVALLSAPIAVILLGQSVLNNPTIVWTFLAPMLVMVVYGPRASVPWLMASLGISISTIFIQPYVQITNPIAPAIQMGAAVGSLLGFILFIFLTLYYFISQRDLAFRLLRGEQEKSENLLLNILPKDIAAILKNESRVIADSFEGASILFADVVNFTPMSAQMSATELVELLNEIFSHFDALVEKHGLEKIKTIGDCYMVASGVPRPRADHAQVLTRMALEMQAYVSGREFQGRKIAFRVGINSGPVVAGVIGRKKFIYDLWGDAVNTASRMESHGGAGLIQITRATYELIKDEFICEPRGTVNVKGKGEMEVWQVAGVKA